MELKIQTLSATKQNGYDRHKIIHTQLEKWKALFALNKRGSCGKIQHTHTTHNTDVYVQPTQKWPLVLIRTRVAGRPAYTQQQFFQIKRAQAVLNRIYGLIISSKSIILFTRSAPFTHTLHATFPRLLAVSFTCSPSGHKLFTFISIGISICTRSAKPPALPAHAEQTYWSCWPNGFLINMLCFCGGPGHTLRTFWWTCGAMYDIHS